MEERVSAAVQCTSSVWMGSAWLTSRVEDCKPPIPFVDMANAISAVLSDKDGEELVSYDDLVSGCQEKSQLT